MSIHLDFFIGWALGSILMWLYFAKFSGLMRTREEFNKARVEGEVRSER